MTRRQCPATILDADSLKWNGESTRLVIANQSSQVFLLIYYYKIINPILIQHKIFQICVFEWNLTTDQCIARSYEKDTSKELIETTNS